MKLAAARPCHIKFRRQPRPIDVEDVNLLGEGVSLLQRVVEADHGIAVQVVVVGDCALDDALRALLEFAEGLRRQVEK